MYCPNCGKKIEDNSSICEFCGSSIAQSAPAEGEFRTSSAAVQQTDMNESLGAENKPKKGFPKYLIVIICIAAVIVIAVILIFVHRAVAGGVNAENPAVYVSDDSYVLVPTLGKDQTIEIASTRSEDVYSEMVKFSPDGEYIYFYTKCDESGGTLCRIEYTKLKKNSQNIDTYIETIDSNVKLGISFFDDGTILYMSENNRLYYYDGNESVQLADSVDKYYFDGDGRVLYTIEDKNESYNLYAVTVSEPENKEKLASQFDSTEYCFSVDCFVYNRFEGGCEKLYVTGFGREEQVLAENVETVYSGTDGLCILIENNDVLLPYDFVTDDYGTLNTEEPDLEEYAEISYRYWEMDAGADPDDYDEIYTSCTNGTAFFNGLNLYEIGYDDELTDIIAFIDKYRDLEDENGYIVVTDEIEKDLKNLAEAYGVGYDGEWLELCFCLMESGRDYDYDSYDAAYDEYLDNEYLEMLREELKDSENEIPLYTLCYYDATELTTICENLVDYWHEDGALIYNTSDMMNFSLDIDSIEDADDVLDYFDVDLEAQNYLLCIDSGSSLRFSGNAADTLYDLYIEEGDEAEFISLENSLVLQDEYSGVLYIAPIEENIVGDFTVLEDFAYAWAKDGVLYYECDMYEYDGNFYFDLYSYTDDNGKARLAADVLDYKVYEDGVIGAYTDVNGSRGYELNLIHSDGEKTFIADDVTAYARTNDSEVLFISDRDLYYFDGENKTKIAIDVDRAWTYNAMQVLF